jgi:chromosome segregation ATPase
MWSVIEIGEYTPLKDATTDAKPQAEWTTTEAGRVLLNTKAKLFIKCALCREEYDRIMECKTAKEMWETLKTHHEGTNHVKETRIDIGVRKFELFEMKEDETVDQMYGRFTVIINELISLGKTYTAHERVRKILRCLPKTWRHIVTAITESKDLTQLKLEDLIGSLRAHESILLEDKPLKKKMTALDCQSEETQNDILYEDTLEEDNEEELALLSRRIQRLMQRRNQLKKSPFKRNVVKTEVDMSKIQCYGCNQFGHYKNDCPKLKQKRPPFKKKSMMATWDELEEISDEEDQEANVCLMTRSEAEEVNLEPCSSCQKTEHLFDNLFYDTHILNQKNSQLKNELSNVTSDLEKFKNDNLVLKQKLEELQNSNNEMTKQIKEFQNKKEDNSSNFQKENISLKEKVSTLEKDITNFIKTTETFNSILGSQKGIFDKAGLGFETYKKQKLYKDLLIP